MKPLLTLALLLTATTALFAQRTNEREEAKRDILGDRKTDYPTSKNDRDVVYRDNRTVYGDHNTRYPSRYPTQTTTRQQRAYDINRAYDAEIRAVQADRRLSRSERQRLIRQLEANRRRDLAALNNRNYVNDSRQCDDDYNNRNAKGNKGNHYGWQKGKGNPHKRNW